jgi:hypothetical protein
MDDDPSVRLAILIPDRETPHRGRIQVVVATP